VEAERPNEREASAIAREGEHHYRGEQDVLDRDGVESCSFGFDDHILPEIDDGES